MKPLPRYAARIAAGLLSLLLLGFQSQAWATVAGGAVIHNAAVLTFNGGTVTSAVNVTVNTIASAPTFTVTPATQSANPGDTANFTYTITNTSNGVDSFSLSASSTNTGVSSPSLGISPGSTVQLGASITSQPSDSSGNVYIPAGSETGFAVGDTVVVNGNVYTIASITPGTPATTTGNTTTPEVPTTLKLTVPSGSGSPVITAGTIPAGAQIGERQQFSVAVTTGVPTATGTDGTSQIQISGNTSAQDTSGSVVNFSDSQNATVTVLSGNATITKLVRNVTKGGSFAASGVTAQTGDVLEYQITAAPLAGQTVTGAKIADEVPAYTTYVTGSTTLNGTAVADDTVGTTAFPLDEGGLTVNSTTGAAGELKDGEQAVVTFQVTVQ